MNDLTKSHRGWGCFWTTCPTRSGSSSRTCSGSRARACSGTSDVLCSECGVVPPYDIPRAGGHSRPPACRQLPCKVAGGIFVRAVPVLRAELTRPALSPPLFGAPGPGRSGRVVSSAFAAAQCAVESRSCDPPAAQASRPPRRIAHRQPSTAPRVSRGYPVRRWRSRALSARCALACCPRLPHEVLSANRARLQAPENSECSRLRTGLSVLNGTAMGPFNRSVDTCAASSQHGTVADRHDGAAGHREGRVIVFVDTCVFRQAGFNLSNPNIVRLLELASRGYATVLITEVVKMEVENQLYESLNRVATGIFNGSHPIFDESFRVNITGTRGKKYDKKGFIDEGMSAWSKFLSMDGVHVELLENVSVSDVLKMHFKKEPPFSKKKPGEFKDAFSLKCVENYARGSNRKICIVSADTDFREACSGSPMRYYSGIESLLAEIDARKSEELARTEKLIDRMRHTIRHDISKLFAKKVFHCWDAADDTVEDVKALEIAIWQETIEDASADRFTVSLELGILFAAHVSYPCLETAIRVSRDERWPWQMRTGLVEDETSASAHLSYIRNSDNGFILDAERSQLTDPFYFIHSIPSETVELFPGD